MAFKQLQLLKSCRKTCKTILEFSLPQSGKTQTVDKRVPYASRRAPFLNGKRKNNIEQANWRMPRGEKELQAAGALE
jgi:hypothetical protein